MKKRGSVFILSVIVGLILLGGTITPSFAQGVTALKSNVAPIGLKSPGTATAWSLFGTAAPIAIGLAQGDAAGGMMFLAGVTFGPSMGYFYAGRSGRGWAGAGIRFGAMTVSIVGLALNYNDESGKITPAAIMFLAPLAFLAGDIIYDITNVHKAAEKYNEKLAQKPAGKIVTIAPEYFGRLNAIGIKAQIKF